MFAFRKIFTVPAVTSVAAASSSSSAALCSKAATLFDAPTLMLTVGSNVILT